MTDKHLAVEVMCIYGGEAKEATFDGASEVSTADGALVISFFSGAQKLIAKGSWVSCNVVEINDD